MAEIAQIPYKDKEEKSKFLRQGNISLILDSYDDLFSDFDPRPNSERSLSVDFVDECKRAVRDREQTTELRLLIPKQKRYSLEEAIIKRRLKEHFTKHLNEKKKELRSITMGGISWFIAGVALSLISAYLIASKPFSGINFLIVLMEPAGWFFFWEGLRKVFIDSKEKRPNYEFYQKMSSAKISFHSY